MISPDFRNTEVCPIIDQYRLYITSNHGMLLLKLKNLKVMVSGKTLRWNSTESSKSVRKPLK